MSRARFTPGRRTLLLAILLTGLIGGGWWWTQPPPEPVFDGWPLSRWISGIEDETHTVYNQSSAIEAMGPAAVKWLIYEVKHGRHPDLLSQPSTIERVRERLFHQRPYEGPDERWLAVIGFCRLDPVPEAAIPALVQALDAGDMDLCGICAIALHRVGPASWTVAQERIAHGSIRARSCLIACLAARIPATRTVASDNEIDGMLDILARACSDPEPAIRWAAVNASADFRRRLEADPRLVPITQSVIRLLGDPAFRQTQETSKMFPRSEYVDERPAARLIAILRDPTPINRIFAAGTLATLDPKQGDPSYELREMTRDPDPECSKAAREALRVLGFPESE